MRPPRNANDWRAFVLEYGARSYTKTMFHGFIYRFLVELLKENVTFLPTEFPDIDEYDLACLTTYRAEPHPSQYRSTTYSFSQLQKLADEPLPRKGEGHVLFLCGHLPGSWIASIGAKYGIEPEFFRRHIHLWRASRGPVLYAVPRLPSVTSGRGLVLRITTQGYSMHSLGHLSLTGRLQVLPGSVEPNPARLSAAPGSSYVRGHSHIGDHHFLIEQDISITIETDGDSWTAILWSDVGNRGLLKSLEFHQFISHLSSCSKTGVHSTRLIPIAMLGKDSMLEHAFPSPSADCSSSGALADDPLVQWASHIPSEHHLLLDYAIAAQDPIYALTPILSFAAISGNQSLAVVTKHYEILTSTVWDPRKSKEHLEQLILHKHILDDHACRHEEVLRFLRSSALTEWSSNLTASQAKTASEARKTVEEDYEYLLVRTRQFSMHHQEAISILVSSVALAESKKQITLATQVTKLTVLATVFLPLSYCTSIFGMNLIEFEKLSVWIWAIVTVSVGLATFVIYQWDERQGFTKRYQESWEHISSRTQRMMYRQPTKRFTV